MSEVEYRLFGKRWSYFEVDLYGRDNDLTQSPHDSCFWVGLRLCMSF
jgi:hypothetical protein